MILNPDPGKQTQEVIFSQKLKKIKHPPLAFNNANASNCKFQKHLRIILDSKFAFERTLQKRIKQKR